MAKRRSQKRARNRARKKTPIHINETDEVRKAPHSMVIKLKKIDKSLELLKTDFISTLEPYTATNLKTTRVNTVKDFVAVAAHFSVTNLVIFSQTDIGCYLRFCRLPHGPTAVFNICDFTLRRDVLSQHRKHLNNVFSYQPYLMLNNFPEDSHHFKLIMTMFQNILPPIFVNKVDLKCVNRCVLFNYNKDTDTIDFRSYAIKVTPCDVNKSIKKLANKKIPNMSQLADISELITKSGMMSDSEAELDGPDNQVDIECKHRPRNIKTKKNAIRLIEMGPRLTLQLIKIEDDLMTGNVLYNRYGNKNSEKTDNTENGVDISAPEEQQSEGTTKSHTLKAKKVKNKVKVKRLKSKVKTVTFSKDTDAR